MAVNLNVNKKIGPLHIIWNNATRNEPMRLVTFMLGTFHAELRLSRCLWREIYIGPEPYMGSDRAYWKPNDRSYFKGPDQYGWYRWRWRYLRGLYKKWSMWTFDYYNGLGGFVISWRGF